MKNITLNGTHTGVIWQEKSTGVDAHIEHRARNLSVHPDVQTTAGMILCLEQPLQLMARMMYETAARLSEIQSIKHADIHQGVLHIRAEKGTCERAFTLSPDLTQAIQEYRRDLRRKYESQQRRGSGFSLGMRGRNTTFANQLLFPLWALRGYEGAAIDDPVPAEVFSARLQLAAHETGYTGTIHSNILRLVCTNNWLIRGVEIGRIHEWLGHRDLMTTLLMVQALQFGSISYVAGSDG